MKTCRLVQLVLRVAVAAVLMLWADRVGLPEATANPPVPTSDQSQKSPPSRDKGAAANQESSPASVHSSNAAGSHEPLWSYKAVEPKQSGSIKKPVDSPKHTEIKKNHDDDGEESHDGMGISISYQLSGRAPHDITYSLVHRGRGNARLRIHDKTDDVISTYALTEDGMIEISVPGRTIRTHKHPDGTFTVDGTHHRSKDAASAAFVMIPEVHHKLSPEALAAAIEILHRYASHKSPDDPLDADGILGSQTVANLVVAKCVGGSIPSAQCLTKA